MHINKHQCRLKIQTNISDVNNITLGVDDQVFLTPYLTDNEYVSYVLPGTHGHVVSLLDPDNEMDVEGSAPGSRLGLFQMLARFENVDVNMDNMKKEAPKSQAVMDAEAFLKANKNTQN